MMDKKNGDWQKKSTFMNFLKVWDERMFFLAIEKEEKQGQHRTVACGC